MGNSKDNSKDVLKKIFREKMKDHFGQPMVRVYYGSHVCSEEIAVFYDEDTYIACLPALEKQAKERRWEFVWESMVDDDVLIEELSDSILARRETVLTEKWGDD